MEVAILVLVGALVADLAFGDPKNRYHPTAWVGTLVAKMAPFGKSVRSEKVGGIIITITITSIVALLVSTYGLLVQGLDGLMLVFSMLTGALLLKSTIAIRGIEEYGRKVIESLSSDDMDEARTRLAMLVKRNTGDLDRGHIASGVLETTSENIVDGITGPIFYYAVFGLAGAFVYRTVNTIDSMMGYRSDMFANLGWFGANCDKVLNYIPSRITSYLMVAAAFLAGADWRQSLLVLRRDGGKTPSPNAGYPMAAMAGALGVRFEKIGHYALGDGSEPLVEQFGMAIRLVKITSALFCGVVAVPLIVILSYLGWWIHV
jgi:adenosylcobinamide-phosphate synthase